MCSDRKIILEASLMCRPPLHNALLSGRSQAANLLKRVQATGRWQLSADVLQTLTAEANGQRGGSSNRPHQGSLLSNGRSLRHFLGVLRVLTKCLIQKTQTQRSALPPTPHRGPEEMVHSGASRRQAADHQKKPVKTSNNLREIP